MTLVNSIKRYTELLSNIKYLAYNMFTEARYGAQAPILGCVLTHARPWSSHEAVLLF